MTYLFNFLLILVYYVFFISTIKDKHKAYKYFAIVAGVHVVLFRALANPFNYVDADNYLTSFPIICDMSFEDACLKLNGFSATGHGFVIYQWLLGRIAVNDYILHSVTAIINISLVVWYYRKVSENIFLPLMIFLAYPMLYYMSFGVIRQHLAAAVILMALCYVDDLKKSLPFYIIAVTIHPSAMIFAVYYVLRKVPLYSMNLVKLLLLGGIFAFFMGKILNVLLSYLVHFQDYESGAGSTNIVPFVWTLGFVTILQLSTIKKVKLPQKPYHVINFSVLGFFLTVFGLGLPGGGRLCIYNYYVLPLAIMICGKYMKKNAKVLYVLYLFANLLLIALLIYMDAGNDNNNYNYSFFWETTTK